MGWKGFELSLYCLEFEVRSLRERLTTNTNALLFGVWSSKFERTSYNQYQHFTVWSLKFEVCQNV